MRKKSPGTKSKRDKGTEPFWKCHHVPSGKGNKEGLSVSLDSAYRCTCPERMKSMNLNKFGHADPPVPAEYQFLQD